MGTRRRYVWMVSRVFMQQATRIAIAWSTASSLCRAGSLFLLLLSSLTLAAQQPHHSATSGKQNHLLSSPQIFSRLKSYAGRAYSIRRRVRCKRNSQRNPASVEAYNMLGFIYIDEKDYEQRCRSIPACLETSSRLSKDSQQPGKRLYV